MNFENALTRLARDLGICVAMAAVFAFMGVYDSDTLPITSRFLFWLVIMVTGALAVSMAEPLVFRRWLPDAHIALQVVVIAALISVPLTLGLVGANTDMRFDFSVTNWMSQALGVFLLSLVIVAGRAVLRSLLANPSIPEATLNEDVVDPARIFLQRLPLKFREAELWAVSSEGHYLRVHTDRGETMILMRLSDAMRELAGAAGRQAHRSWWVAEAGLADIDRKAGRTTLVLKSGVEVPVSRSRQAEVRAAGWLV